MSAELRRRYRVAMKAALLVSLPLTGILWAFPTTGFIAIGAVALTLFNLALAIGTESLATSAEGDLKLTREQLDNQAQTAAAQIAVYMDKVRQLDRIIDTLSNQNHDLRGKLLSLHAQMPQTFANHAPEDASAAPVILVRAA